MAKNIKTMKKSIRLTESDLTRIVKKVYNQSNILLKEQWVRGKDSIGYWKILFDQLKKLGIGVKWQVPNNPAKSTFMYWGGWIIWKDMNKNGGYPVSFTDKVANVSMVFKFDGGKYAGQPANNVKLVPKSIKAYFNLGQFGKLKNETVSKSIEKYKKSHPLNNSVISIYKEIVDAVVGIGTDPNKIVLAISKLKNQNEFKYLLTLFGDKKTGYSSFFDMVNQEYDRTNAEDVKKLMVALQRINVFTDANFGENPLGITLFGGFFKLSQYMDKTPDYTEVMKKCRVTWTKALPKAIKWWKDWLSDPITKQKFENNWDTKIKNISILSVYQIYNKISADRAYEKYFELLNNIHLHFYNRKTIEINGNVVVHGALAFVTKPDGNIYVNCSSSSAKNVEQVEALLIHEIQHMIYEIKPLNPTKKIGSSFDSKNCNIESREQIKSNLSSNTKNNTKNYSPIINSTAKKLGVKPEHILHWEKETKRVKDPSDPDYICRETEKMSNIMSMRRTLNIKPGGNITYNMLKPYITSEKYDIDVFWFLCCWVEKGYPDFNQMLNNINQLALKKTESTNKNIT